jgi:hypothetical protein
MAQGIQVIAKCLICGALGISVRVLHEDGVVADKLKRGARDAIASQRIGRGWLAYARWAGRYAP